MVPTWAWVVVEFATLVVVRVCGGCGGGAEVMGGAIVMRRFFSSTTVFRFTVRCNEA